MADKSSSQIVHQNNHPASAVANNDSVLPQHDAAAQTADPNIPATDDIDSAEVHAEPITSNDDREDVTAEWLTQQVFFFIEPIDKAKRKSDLDQLFNEIKSLSEPAYHCTKVWRSLLSELGQEYFDWFLKQMYWLLGLCKSFVAINQDSSSSTPALPIEHITPLSNQFCICALQAYSQFLGSSIPTSSPDKRAYLLSAFSCTGLFESYIKKLKRATKSSLDGIDLEQVLLHLKAYDAMRFMGQHILAEHGIKKEQFAGIGHRSVATRVNSGADIDNGIKSIDRHVKHRIKSEVLNQADNQLFDEREQALDAEYTKTFPPQAPKTPGGQASEIQLDHKSAVDIYQQQLHHKSTLAQIDPVTASKIDPVKEAELVAVTEQSATGVAPENITYVIVPTAQCLTEERQDELTGFSHGKTSIQAVNTLWVLKYNPATETAVLLPYGSGSAVMQPLKFQGGLPTRLFLEQRYDNVMEGKSIASCVRALLDQGFDLSPRTFTQNCHAFDTLLTDDAVSLFTRLHKLSNSTTQVDETFHVILSNGTLDTESSKEQINGKCKDKGKGKGGNKKCRKQINRVYPMVIMSANSDDFPVAIFVVADSRSYKSLKEVLLPILEGSKTQVLVSDKYRPYIRIAKDLELENAFCHAHALRYNYNAVMASIEAMQKLLAKNIEDVKNANGYKEDSELTQSDRDLIESKLMEHIKSFSKEDKAMMVALACQSNLFKVNRLNADTWAKAKAKSQNYSNNGTLTSEERQAAIDEVMRRSEQYGRVFFELFVKILNNLKHSEKAATYKAANYVCNDVDAFSTCLKHGFVPMDNNSSESMMKQAAVVRKHQLANQDLANLRSIFDDKTVFVTMLKLGYGKESILNLAERMSTLRFEHILSRQAELCYSRDGHGENLQRDLWSLSLKSHSTTFTPWRYIVDFLKEERDRLRAQGQEIIALPADTVAIALQEEKQRVDQATADFKQYLADLKEQRLASQKSA